MSRFKTATEPTRMTIFRVFALACLTVLPALGMAAGDSDRGRELAERYRCITCHGVEGRSPDRRYPHLAGQQPAYLVTRLQYFRDGIEPFNEMNGHARPLTDEMMQDLAAYFSEQRL